MQKRLVSQYVGLDEAFPTRNCKCTLYLCMRTLYTISAYFTDINHSGVNFKDISTKQAHTDGINTAKAEKEV